MYVGKRKLWWSGSRRVVVGDELLVVGWEEMLRG